MDKNSSQYSSPPAGLLVLAASGVGLSLGFIDLIVNIFPGGHLFRSSHYVIPPFALVTGFYFLATVTLWLLVGSWAARRASLRRAPTLFSLCIFIFIIGGWYELNALYRWIRLDIPRNVAIGSLVITLIGYPTLRLLQRRGRISLSASLLLLPPVFVTVLGWALWFRINEIEHRWGVDALNRLLIVTERAGIAVVASAGAIASYAYLIRCNTPGRIRFHFTLSAALPLAVGWIALLLWIAKCSLGGFHSGASIAALLAAAFVLVFVVIGSAMGKRRIAYIVLPICLAASAGSPLINAGRDWAGRTRSAPYISENREIKHIILLTIDTLRTDVLSCYSDAGENTKNIDLIASDGALLTRAYSEAPWTLPSFASIMTGLSTKIHQTTRAMSALPASARTMAEYLQKDGYYTAAIGHNPILGPNHGLKQGFESYDFYPKRRARRCVGVAWIHRIWPDFYRVESTTESLGDSAIRWIEAHQKKDFFLWLHFFDPHIPYSPPEAYLPEGEMRIGRVGKELNGLAIIKSGFEPDEAEKEWIRQLYRAEVRYVDDQVGRVVDKLRSLGIYDDSLIVLTSDHGEEHWDHGGFEHGHTLYEELIHVPLIVKPPNSKKSTIRDDLVSTAASLPTILDLAGVDYDSEKLSYRSFAPLVGENSQHREEQPVFAGAILKGYPREAVLFDSLKYTRAINRKWDRLIDLEKDPKESNSIAETAPDSVAQARNHILHHEGASIGLRTHHGMEIETETELDPDTIDQLKRLGYIGGN